ncbi:hypothetical protein SK128_003249, partial [Halocaridina rubra]
MGEISKKSRVIPQKNQISQSEKEGNETSYSMILKKYRYLLGMNGMLFNEKEDIEC